MASDQKLFTDLVAKAKSGDTGAQWELGIAYKLGSFYWNHAANPGCILRDEKASVEWFQSAAKRGDYHARLLMFVHYDLCCKCKNKESKMDYWREKANEVASHTNQMIIQSPTVSANSQADENGTPVSKQNGVSS